MYLIYDPVTLDVSYTVASPAPPNYAEFLAEKDIPFVDVDIEIFKAESQYLEVTPEGIILSDRTPFDLTYDASPIILGEDLTITGVPIDTDVRLDYQMTGTTDGSDIVFTPEEVGTYMVNLQHRAHLELTLIIEVTE